MCFSCGSNYELFSQNYSVPKEHLLSHKDSMNLYYLGLDIKNTKYDHLKLRHLISLNKKSRLNNIIGTIFRTGGYIFGGFGVIFLATAPSQNTGLGQGISVLIGASCLNTLVCNESYLAYILSQGPSIRSVGTIGYGISVPFKSASKRRVFERDYMIQKMQQQKE